MNKEGELNMFDKEEYGKLNTQLHKDNGKALDMMCFVINAIFLLFQTTILVKSTLILMLIGFLVSMKGNDLAIGEDYETSNKLFNVSDFINVLVVVLTIITIVLAF